MRISKISVVFWGAICIGAAFLFGGSDSPVIEIINAIGSVFYGPVLATFVLAVFSKKVNATGMKAGIIIAVLINLVFSKTMQNMFGLDFGFSIFWMWLNFTGFALTVAIAYLVSAITPTKASNLTQEESTYKLPNLLSKEPIILLSYFVLILAICYMVPSIFG